MAQHKLNQKKSKASTAGIQKKAKKPVQKRNAKAPKKGAQMTFAPKKKGAVQEAKMNKTVTQVINQRNEEMLRGRADQYTGRNSNKK